MRGAVGDAAFNAVLECYHEDFARARCTSLTPDLRRPNMPIPALEPLPATGQYLNSLVRGLDRPTVLELGTSYGYSGLWLAEAAAAVGGRLITMDEDPETTEFARLRAEEAGIDAVIDYWTGDMLGLIDCLEETVDFVLVDLWHHADLAYFEALLPRLNPGSLLVADHVAHPLQERARRYVDALRALPCISSVMSPLGVGVSVSRYDPIPADMNLTNRPLGGSLPAWRAPRT